jgi:glutathione S-transferase
MHSCPSHLMKLYITSTSPYARIARIVVLEKGLEERVELIVAQTRTTESPYYTINPSGRVPYLVREDGVGLEDSALICSYLDNLDSAAIFDLPLGEQAWEARRLEVMARSMLDGLAVWGRELYRPVHERSATIVEHESNRSQRMADLWERTIDQPLMHGQLNLLQITLVAGLQLELRNPEFTWRPGRPRLSAWADRMAERPSIAATMPPELRR